MPRIPDSIKNPRQILSSTPGTLHRLLDHARQLIDLQDQLRDLVSGELYVAACDDGCLHLITPSAALATRIKYNQRKLLAQVRRSGRNVARIKISVRPEFGQTRAPLARSAPQLSAKNAGHLVSVAKCIEDEGLRKALIQLSQRATDINMS